MAYAEVGGYAVMALGGFTLGVMYGKKLAADALGLLQALELRIGSVEQAMVGSAVGGAKAQAAATDHHAAAVEKLAGAIEKHAAAVDDHGAATVAAAVEHASAGVSSAPAKG